MKRALLILVASACGGPQLSSSPSTAVAKFLPAQLEAHRAAEGEPRTATIRVYADAAVRALPHWREDITEQIDYASQLLTPLAGVKLTVESVEDWDRSGEPHAALQALAALDRGDGVTWVVGYIAPNDRAATAMSELGDGQTLGRHAIVRAWAADDETTALAAKLPDARDPSRGEVLAAHQRHKQTVVLLHHLAATLGAVAEADPSWIQNPSYSPAQSGFSDRDRELIQIALAGRLSDKPAADVAKQLLSAIEKSEWGGWIGSDRDNVSAVLRSAVDASRAGKTATDVPPAAYDAFNRARELAKARKTGDALVELTNLIAAYPGNASMQELKCEILIAKPGVADPETRKACARVSEIAPGDPLVHIAVGEALVRVGDLAGARAELAQAEGKIENLQTGAADAWRKVIGLYEGAVALTWAEEASARAKLDVDPQIAQKRARYGIPRGAKFVKPADEAALVKAIRGALDLVYASKFGEAERAIAAAEKRWPNAPGVEAARCDLALRQEKLGAARAACNHAIALDKDDSWALYLAGVLALRDAGGTREGVAKLRAAIAVDPELGQAWRTLALAYARAKDTAALEQLSADYQTKFGQALPPPPQ